MDFSGILHLFIVFFGVNFFDAANANLKIALDLCS